MKPTRAQYYFAGGQPFGILFQVLIILFFIGIPLCFTCIVAGILAHVYPPLSNIWNLLWLAFFVVVALMLGFLLALVAASCLAGIFWPIFRPIFDARAIKNGAPFRVGDHVQILTGRHKGRIVRVYSDWKDASVRVELGEKEKEEFKDIFDPIQLLRENIEPAASPNSPQPSQLPMLPEVQWPDSQRASSSGSGG